MRLYELAYLLTRYLTITYRLTFWLSNSIVLRTIVSQAAVSLKTQVSSGSQSSKNDANWESSKAASTLKWKAASPNKRENGNGRHGSSGDWEDIHTFTSALEKVEAWIFSRIIESIWWQVLNAFPSYISSALN